MTISIRTLLLIVACCAIGAAGLTQASVLWLRLIFSAAMLFLAWSLVAAIFSSPAKRPFWIGTLIFGGCYFLLLIDGGDTDDLGGSRPSGSMLLVTHQLLTWGGRAFGYPSQWEHISPWSKEVLDDSEYTGIQTYLSRTTIPPPSYSTGVPYDASSPNTGFANQPPISQSQAPAMNPKLTPLSLARYYLIGHCLIVILTGLVGGFVTQAKFGQLAAEESPTPPGTTQP